MGTKWHGTNVQGIRYREHPTRKHGSVKKDKYFAIRVQVNGKRHEEGLGWESDGWTFQDAVKVLADLKRNHALGEGFQTLGEKRKQEEERRKAQAEEKERLAKEMMTLVEFFQQEYLPSVDGVLNSETIRKQKEHFKNWLGPVISNVPMKSLNPFHLEKIKSEMLKAAKRPRTIQYVFQTFRGVWNQARRLGYVQADSPTRAVKLPPVDNIKIRVLTKEETIRLFEELRQRSTQTYHIALVSLDTGMRFSEVARLTWGYVDLKEKQLLVLNTKARLDRTVPMTSRLRDLFQAMGPGTPNELVFKSRIGGRIGKVSNEYWRAIKATGLNAGVTDPKMKFTFHSLRHQFASNLINEDVDLYTIQKMLGQKTPIIAQRYAHILNPTFRKAISKLDSASKMNTGVKVISMERR